MARSGCCAKWRALATKRALRRASPNAAPPNSCAAQDSASSPSPSASGTAHARCGHRQAFPPRRLQFIHIHCLARLGRRMGAVLTTAPRGLTYAHPVRRPPTRPGVLALVNERLQQPRPIGAVTALEVRAHCPAPPASQDVRKPSCPKTPRGGSETGPVPPPGAVGCGAPCRSQPIQRIGAPAGAAREVLQSRRHPAQPCAEPTRLAS